MSLVVKPLHNNVLVKRHESAEESPGGIVIPDAYRNQAQKIGDVVAVGPGLMIDGEWHDTQVEEGESVIFPEFAGVDFSIGDEDYLVINELDILCRVFDDGEEEVDDSEE